MEGAFYTHVEVTWTWWAFPLKPSYWVKKELELGAWTVQWWTTKSRGTQKSRQRPNKKHVKLLRNQPESPQLWFPARKMTTLPNFKNLKVRGRKISWPACAVQMKQTPFDNQADCKRQVTWSRSCNLCCVARLSSCNDANDNAFLEHASMMCVTFEGHKNSAICSSQQSIGKHLYTFVGIYPSFASFNFVSSSWHSLSCCKSRLKREDFCKGGGCCGRRMGAGIAVTLAGR